MRIETGPSRRQHRLASPGHDAVFVYVNPRAQVVRGTALCQARYDVLGKIQDVDDRVVRTLASVCERGKNRGNASESKFCISYHME